MLQALAGALRRFGSLHTGVEPRPDEVYHLRRGIALSLVMKKANFGGQVKCDERPGGCLNCERLQLNCVQPTAEGAGSSVKEQADHARALTGIKRKRTFRVCVPCRQSKIRCSGERPSCSRCRQRATTCVYDAEAAEPAWVHSVAPSATHGSAQETMTSTPSPPVPQNALASISTSLQNADLPPSLAWYVQKLLCTPRRHSD